MVVLPPEEPRSDGAERKQPVPKPRCHCRITVCLTAAQVLVMAAGIACQVYQAVHGL